ncbi:PLP-dependent aminotransferase family protein [Magnetospirillum molischianum]|uniref:Glycine dehydrogenase (aminomethyl-transferring) n=1 Tax=Magnetospirillum molischianum DSM 120 TaxID=1150626 RepID=H8FQJ5_MAGML|nr:hypothetical protein [Magnetospirillum molischianum]CCG40633.1 exported hypothetical protein [Magnetospirillum molischianum DSM 120]
MSPAPAADPLSALIGGAAVAPAQNSVAEACVVAVRRACAVTGRRRVILSGSLHPVIAATVEAALGPDGIVVECLAPDPLGIEDLAGRTSWDLAALVVQTPDPFGGLHSFGLAASLCREDGTVPVAVVADPAMLALYGPPDADLVVVDGCIPWLEGRLPLGLIYGRAALSGWADDGLASPAPGATAEMVLTALARLGPDGLAIQARAADAAADRIAARLRRVRGLSVVSGERFASVVLYLGDESDAETVAQCLPRLSGIEAVPAARLYPGWPELWPVLMLAVTGPISDDVPDRLAAALAR